MKRLNPLVAALVVGAGAAIAQQGIPGEYFVDQWDGDGDGQVSPEEARTKRSDVFVMFDQSEDGIFQADEWEMIADHLAAENAAQGQGTAQGMGRGPGAHVRAAMEAPFNDLDGNGEVTAAEFTAATDKLFELLDQNGDGVLTPDDFRRR